MKIPGNALNRGAWSMNWPPSEGMFPQLGASARVNVNCTMVDEIAFGRMRRNTIRVCDSPQHAEQGREQHGGEADPHRHVSAVRREARRRDSDHDHELGTRMTSSTYELRVPSEKLEGPDAERWFV